MAYSSNYDMGSIKLEVYGSSIKVTCNKAYYATSIIGSYKAQVYAGSTFVKDQTSSTNIINITGLSRGTKYTVIVRAYQSVNAGGNYGNTVQASITTPKILPSGHVSSTQKVPSSTSNNSTFTYSGGSWSPTGTFYPNTSSSSTSKKKTVTTKTSNASNDGGDDGDVSNSTTAEQSKYGSVTKSKGNSKIQRSLLVLDSQTLSPVQSSVAVKNTGISMSGQYYNFGTGLFFASNIDGVKASGGLGFFTDDSGQNGYFIKLETTEVVGKEQKKLRLLKAVNGKLKRIDTEDTAKELALVYGATLYRIDVFVKATSTANIIDVYVNGYKITYTDNDNSGTDDLFRKKIDPTSNIALFCNLGQAYFDYAYASPITEDAYSKKNNPIRYKGQNGDATLKSLFGDRVISNFGKLEIQGGYLEEFGTTARELLKTNVKFANRPGFPLYVSTGINQYVQILGSRMTSFGADIYALNNAGTFMPLANSNAYTYSVWGNYISEPGAQEYSEDLYSANTYNSPEPVVFESMWIQTESDAKYLASFIKNQWSKQQSSVDMEVFGNPIIAVGDIVTINYPENELSGTEKFLVTSINSDFTEGVSTKITARSIYS